MVVFECSVSQRIVREWSRERTDCCTEFHARWKINHSNAVTLLALDPQGQGSPIDHRRIALRSEIQYHVMTLVDVYSSFATSFSCHT